MKLKCKDCGIEYEKPDYFTNEVNNTKGWLHFYFLRSIQYCDICRRKREIDMLRALPKVLEAIGNINQEGIE